MMSETVGMVGLGEMGGPMAARLLDGGWTVYGYNRTREKAEPYCDKGLRWAHSPRELAASCDFILSMITGDSALEAIAYGDDGVIAGLRAGAIWIDLSTTSPNGIRQLKRPVEATGATLLDGAVLGSSVTVEQGQALILIAGAERACERVTDVLRAIGSDVRPVGEVGHAKVMKIALNLNLPVQILALSEGVLLAEKSGIDRQVALDVMLGGVVASPMLKYRAPFIISMPQRPRFDVTMMQKDVRLALDLGREVKVPLPTAGVAAEMLTAAGAMGLSRYDFAALFHALARMSGLDAVPAERDGG